MLLAHMASLVLVVPSLRHFGLKDSAGLLAWLDSVNFEPTRFGQHFHGQGVVNQ